MQTTFQQLLVHIDSTPRCAARLDLACQLATAYGARLQALYAVTPSYVSMPYPGGTSSALSLQLQALDEEKRRAARARFDAAVAKAGVGATWGETTDFPLLPSYTQQARHADLALFGQHEPVDTSLTDTPPDFIASVLAASGRPGLVVPYAGAFELPFGRVMIAWKDSAESARAVAAALPFLQRAQQVHVQSWAQESAASRGTCLDLASYLHSHGISAQFHVEPTEPDSVGELLLSRAYDLEADLIVMGCYGHSRAREWLLGGVSRTILQSMTVPVLMSH